MAKILIISPDFNLRTMMEARLLMDGYEVFTAEDGLLGFDRVQEVKPHLLILEAVLPKISGHQLIEKVRALPDFEKTPMIVITGKGWVEDLIRKDDVFYFCPKPILPVVFMEKVALAVKPFETETVKAPEPEPKQEAPEPPPASAKKVCVVLAGPQEFILKKVKGFFESVGFSVEMAVNEEDVLRKAATRPDGIFVQYCENLNVFNVRTIDNKLGEKEELREIPFYVISHEKIANYARDFVPADHLIVFNESTDLVISLKRLVAGKKKSA
jgi:PleD family two-component response regulator